MTSVIVRICLAAAVGFSTLAAAVSAYARSFGAEEPERALALYPNHTEGLVARLELALLDADGAVTNDVTSVARDLLRRAPLEELPLIYLGLAAAAAENHHAAVLLYTAALERDPRNRRVRLWLAEAAASLGSHADAVVQYRVLTALDPRFADAHARAALDAFHTTDGREAILTALSEPNSGFRSSVLRILRGDEAYLDLFAELADVIVEFQPHHLERLIASGRPREAVDAWMRYSGASHRDGVAWPLNPQFKNALQPGPFGWRLMSDAAAVTPEGLLASHTGGRQATIAQQLIALDPGDYRIEVTLRGDTPKEGARLVWRIQCHPATRDLLAELALAAGVTMETARTVSSEFAIDGPPVLDCPIQSLVLVGLPGILPLRSEVVIKEVRIYENPTLELRGN